MLVSDTLLSDDEQALLKVTYENLLESKHIGPEILELPDVTALCAKLRETWSISKDNIKPHVTTTKLWLQYMTMFEIMLNFIRSDRIGSFIGKIC